MATKQILPFLAFKEKIVANETFFLKKKHEKKSFPTKLQSTPECVTNDAQKNKIHKSKKKNFNFEFQNDINKKYAFQKRIPKNNLNN